MRPLLVAWILLGATMALCSETVTLSGRVTDSRMIVHRKIRSALFYLRLKVEVDQADSGRALLRGAKVIEVRCWRETDAEGRTIGGHQPIPADGAAFSAVLLGNPEGFFEPAAADAIVLADATAGRTFPILTKAPSTTGIVVGGIVGLLMLAAAGYARYRGRGPKDRSWGEPPREESGD